MKIDVCDVCRKEKQRLDAFGNNEVCPECWDILGQIRKEVFAEVEKQYDEATRKTVIITSWLKASDRTMFKKYFGTQGLEFIDSLIDEEVLHES